MYKVFIDHKQIIFANESEMSPNLVSVAFDMLNAFSADISVLMQETTLDTPLQIICTDVLKSYNTFLSTIFLLKLPGE